MAFLLNPLTWTGGCCFLANLFTRVNSIGLIPPEWHSSIIVPLHKAGEKDNPKNYRLVTLLSVIGETLAAFFVE